MYAIEALKKYGAIKGSILATYRVLRCNPWGGHGYDPPRWFGEPVPDSKSFENENIETGTFEETEPVD